MKRLFSGSLALVFLTLLNSHLVFSMATSFCVDDTSDGSVDISHCDANCSDGTNNCRLRDAITAANLNPGPGADTILFMVPGTDPNCDLNGVCTFKPSAGYPPVLDSVSINGYTQAGASSNSNGPGLGNNAVLKIVLDGSMAGVGANGLNITASFCSVQGLVIGGFSQHGIVMGFNGGNFIRGNFIGTNAAGTSANGNGFVGISLTNSTNNVIGGQSPPDRNIISGSINNRGISISGPASTNNAVAGNFIGTDATGTVPLGNSSDGILITGGASGNPIGGSIFGFGNLISGNLGDGIRIDSGSKTNQLQGNLIGTDITGTLDLGNLGNGVVIEGDMDTVGGPAVSQRNVISGNNQYGVLINGNLAFANHVENNFIGVDFSGTLPLPNGSGGVSIDNQAFSNSIGGNTGSPGTCTGLCNVISGNLNPITFLNNGVVITNQSHHNAVLGNFIGLDINGNNFLPNNIGVLLNNGANHNFIGGSISSSSNIISGNNSEGILFTGNNTSDNSIQGNFIGTTGDGTSVLNNGSTGISLVNASGNSIGGPNSGEGNVIAGNGNDDGIQLTQAFSLGNRIQGNFIGTDTTGTLNFGNLNGIRIDTNATLNLVGGSMMGASNLIKFNEQNGVLIDAASNNQIQQNSIFLNGLLGIELTNGGNNNQVAPNLTSAVNTAGSTLVEGTLNSTPGSTFIIEFFANDVCDPSGFGEGQTFLGAINVITNGNGHSDLSESLNGAAVGQFITAVATAPNFNTSVFSNCQVVTPNSFPPPPPPLTHPGTLQFTDNELTVDQGDSVMVEVTRTGGSAGQISSQVSTQDQSAQAGVDYTAVNKTVTFFSGDITSQTIQISTIKSETQENQTFIVILSDPSGGASIGSPDQVTVTILGTSHFLEGGGCRLARAGVPNRSHVVVFVFILMALVFWRRLECK